tara:strand:- start:380 stop:715 length:336 start_codon:yes stop_codon:yes gene_type:complete
MKHSITTRKEGFQIDIGKYTLSIGCGFGHYCENYTGSFDKDNKPTNSMEVALMERDTSNFVVLDQDVAAYIPCSRLAKLIVAVEREDWKMFCDLCDAEMKDITKCMGSAYA